MNEAITFVLAWLFLTATIAGATYLIGYVRGGEHMNRRMRGKVGTNG